MGIDFLINVSAEAIVHCGDIENVAGIKLLGDSGLPSYLVAGNMDVSNFGRLRAAADRFLSSFTETSGRFHGVGSKEEEPAASQLFSRPPAPFGLLSGISHPRLRMGVLS